MKTQRFIAVDSFGKHIGADPMQYINEGEGMKVLGSLIKWENKTFEQCVKIETIDGKKQVSFCEKLTYMFLNMFNPEFCQFVFGQLSTSKI